MVFGGCEMGFSEKAFWREFGMGLERFRYCLGIVKIFGWTEGGAC